MTFLEQSYESSGNNVLEAVNVCSECVRLAVCVCVAPAPRGYRNYMAGLLRKGAEAENVSVRQGWEIDGIFPQGGKAFIPESEASLTAGDGWG